MQEQIVCRVLTGATASGKTELSLELAERNGWEIACMDSMQIYRGMNIGTAKPTPEEQSRVPHHLLDLISPWEGFSVAMYREKAENLIREKWQQGKSLLFVGGTGLYLQALMHPLGMGAVPANETLRQELHMLADSPEGRQHLHDLLHSLDPVTALRLPVNDVRRTIRAIEVSQATGIPFSAQPPREEKSPFIWRAVALELPRDILYDRINQRVNRMLDAGLEQEVRTLLAQGVPRDAQCMQGLGYKEMVLYLDGILSLDKARDEIQKGTRHYAKRQGTFFRREPSLAYVSALGNDTLARLESAII